MSFRLVPKSATLNDPEQRNGPHFALFHRIRKLPRGHCAVVEDVVVKKVTIAISSPDEFLVLICGFFLSSFFFSPLFSAVADWMSTIVYTMGIQIVMMHAAH